MMLRIRKRELCYHAAVFLLYLYADKSRVVIPGNNTKQYGGRYKHLTSLNLYFMLIYYGFSLFLVDLYNLLVKYTKQQQTNHLTCKLRTFRDHYFASLLFPLSVVVTVLFWGVYYIDAELILPLWKQKYIPLHGFL